MSPCSCSGICYPQIQVDIPHPHSRLTVACLEPERPVDCDTVWDFDCEACLRHARIIVRAIGDFRCSVWIPGWPRKLTLRAALALKDPLHPDLPPIELPDHLAEMRDYVENG